MTVAMREESEGSGDGDSGRGSVMSVREARSTVYETIAATRS